MLFYDGMTCISVSAISCFVFIDKETTIAAGVSLILF